MARAKKPKPIRVKDPEFVARLRRAGLHSLAAIIFIALLGVGFWHMRRYVLRDVVAQSRPPRIVLKERPPWMSEALAIQILSSIRPAAVSSTFDRQLLVDTAKVLKGNPWVKQVRQVRRAYGSSPGDTLEIDCEFRAPIALVHWKDFYWLVDGEGVKLPEQFTSQQVPAIVVGSNRKLNIRIIENVQHAPVESGKVWQGDDLLAGLDLVRVLYGKPYAEEIVKVDVANFGGRIDPKEAQINLVTRYDTRIHWGRPVNARDFFVEVPTAQKLRYLEQVYAQFHRVDGGRPWIDIRFDRITYPSGETTAQVNGR